MSIQQRRSYCLALYRRGWSPTACAAACERSVSWAYGVLYRSGQEPRKGSPRSVIAGAKAR